MLWKENAVRARAKRKHKRDLHQGISKMPDMRD